MAEGYAAVLQALNQPFTVIGRGETSAARFAAATGVQPVTGGLEHFLQKQVAGSGRLAIVATGTENLMDCVRGLTRAGIRSILVEKPAAISIEELLQHEAELQPVADSIYVAYNRRYYASVAEAQRLVQEDGGLQSIHFEFTEWAHRIEPLQKAPGVKENWFFANSTHVVDLAFYLAGDPAYWNAYSKKGTTAWHEKTNFAGAGITSRGVLFSYLSNWESAGRWSIELLTGNRRIYLKPLEQLFVQMKGSVALEPHIFEDAADKAFKPGLYLQVKEFLQEQPSLLTIREHIERSRNIYAAILAGSGVHV
jgi:predicted dehydrogenase